MTNPTSDNRIFTGLPGAPGTATGPAFRWEHASAPVATAGDPAAALGAAFAGAAARLTAALVTADGTLAPLLEAQRLMLDDPELRDGVFARVTAGVPPAEAVTATAGELAALLEGAGSDYFRERAIDVRAVGTLIVEALSGSAPRAVPAGVVVIAEELAPLDTTQLAEAGVAALVTHTGGPTCHAAIIARAWGIPAVVGAPAELLALPAGTPLHVDGNAGHVIANPAITDVPLLEGGTVARPPDVPVHIPRRIPVYANVGSLAEARRARELGAEGIGLCRTEFLFLDRATPPSEDEQTEVYTAILRAMEGRPVVIRTLDIGADKPAPFLPLPPELNPQLGLRGIRLCLRERDLFAVQLRALLHATTAGPLKIMLPMVTTVAEVTETRALLGELAAELALPVPPLGAMIEVPMAALAAPELAAVCDFFSLGTNDLMQFLLAADRQHAGVGYLHVVDHPAVWRLLDGVIAAAHAAGIPVGVCGEWGADPDKLARLVARGLDTASVAPPAVPRVMALFTG